MIRALAQDLRYSLRSLSRRPWFTVAAVSMLAFGIGSATAAFTLLDALLLRPLDIRDPERLIRLTNRRADAPGPLAFSYPMWQMLREDLRSFDGMFAWAYPALTVELGGRPERVAGLLASGDMFQTLGVGPAVGRVLAAEDDEVSERAVVLGYDFWRRRFGADPEVVGSAIRLEWQSYTIVGVAAEGFAGLQPGVPCELIIPLSNMDSLRKGPDWRGRRLLWLQLHGRLGAGVSIAQARADLNALWPGVLEATIPERASAERERLFRTHTVDVESAARGWSRYQDLFANPLYVLAGVVGLLLAIICVNLANLMLANASSRRRETAIRLALGAGRARVFRQVAIEVLLLTAGGAVLGLGVSVSTSQALVALWDTGPGRIVLDLRLDPRVFGFLALATLVVALVAGLVPAWRTAWRSPTTPIKEGAASLAGRRSRLAAALMAAQIAFSLCLLTGAGLLTRSLSNLRHQTVDFQQDRVLLLTLSPIMGSYGERDVTTYYSELLEDVRAMPGVESAAFTDHVPTGNWPMPFGVTGAPGRAANEVTTTTGCVSPELFQTLKTPLLAGRWFDSRDHAEAQKAVVINDALAEQLFGGADPLGEWIGFGMDPDVRDKQIIGVVRDRGYRGFRRARTPAVYTPCRQRGRDGRLTLVVRTAGSPGGLLRPIRERIAGLGVELPVRVTTLREQADQTLVRERALAAVSSVFAAAALLLAAFGLFALVSYTVKSQTREIGVRLALGASTGRVLRWVMLRALQMTVAGVAVGLPAAFLTGRYAESLLFGVSPADLRILGLAAALHIVVALAAALTPARRAASIEPMRALREE